MKFATITFAAALFAVAAPASAQQQQERQQRPQARAERMDPKQRVERRVQMLDERLNLNDSQETRIRTILTQGAEQMQAHFGNRQPGQRAARNDAARDSMRAQMHQARERTDAAILQVLNADQRAAYQKLQAEKKDRGGRGGRDRDDRRGNERRS